MRISRSLRAETKRARPGGSNTSLAALAAGVDAAFEIVVSSAIVEEVLRALAYPKIRKHIRGNVEPELWFEDIVILAQFSAGEYEVRGVSEDPDDDKYIAAAVEGRAAFVVSGDPHLLGIKQHEGLRFVSPRTLLGFLGD